MDHECRLLLQVAALLHDIGQFVSLANHHRHTFYLLKASPVIGLNPKQMDLVANIARYHRKSIPRPSHKPYGNLTPKDRAVIDKLAAILRIADALDHDHGSKVHAARVHHGKAGFIMKLRGEGDLLLEKWALARKSDLFEQTFGANFAVDEAVVSPNGGFPRAISSAIKPSIARGKRHA